MEKFIFCFFTLFLLINLIICQSDVETHSRFNQINSKKIEKLVIFGNEFNDIGNSAELSAADEDKETYPRGELFDGNEGSATNGRVWWEVMINKHFPKISKSKDVQSYAYAGAGVDNSNPNLVTGSFCCISISDLAQKFLVPGLAQQVDMFLQNNETPLPENSLVIINVGPNDYFNPAHIAGIEAIQAAITQVVSTVALQVQRILTKLTTNSYIMVQGLPYSINHTPFLDSFTDSDAQNAQIKEAYRIITALHNGNLGAAVQSIDAQLVASVSTNRAIWVDFSGWYAQVLATPESFYNILETEKACFQKLDGSSIYSKCGGEDKHLWWDSWFFSRRYHELVSFYTSEFFLKKGDNRLWTGAASSLSSSNFTFLISLMVVVLFFCLF